MRILVVGWDSGGGVEAVQTVVRRAVQRGHQVRVLGTEGLRSRFESAGASFRVYRYAPDNDCRSAETDIVKEWEARTPLGGFARVRDRVMFGPAREFCRDVTEELDREPADVVVVDVLIPTALSGALSHRPTFRPHCALPRSLEDPMVFQQEEVLFRNGYDIGIGVAMATGSPMALGAVGAVTPPSVGTGGSASFTFRRIDTTGELETELGIGADVSAGIGLFRGSASFDFSRRCKIQSSSLTVLVSAEERFAFQQMDSPELSEPASKLVGSGQTDRFASQFGDYFVRGISTGGRFFGVVRIETKSMQAKSEVDAVLSGSYGLTMSADVRLHVTQAMSNASARAEAFIISDGGTITTRPTSGDPVKLLEELFQAMDEWTATVRKEPKAYSVTVAPYAIALGPTPPNIAEIEHQRDVLIRCAKLRSQTLDKLNLLDYMLDLKHAEEFEFVPPPDGPDLPALQAALAGDLDVIADAASFSINNLKEARDPETFMREVQHVEGFKLTALPANLPKHTGPRTPLPAPTIPVPTFRRDDDDRFLKRALDCLSLKDVDKCLQEAHDAVSLFSSGGVGIDPDPGGFIFHDFYLELFTFLKLVAKGTVRLTFRPDPPGDGTFVVGAQTPAAGTLIRPDDEVVLDMVHR